MVTKTEFERTIKKFNKMEDARDAIWYRAEHLIEKGNELDAYLLILATWNFARFRYAMKNFDLDEFEKGINKLRPVFDKLKSKRFETVDFDKYGQDVETIYDWLAKVDGVEYTGATKIMALNNSNLFVMWDVAIRKMYNKELPRNKKIPQKPKGSDYVNFLKHLREKFEGMRLGGNKKSLAKAIDEYNYVKAEKFR